MARTAHFLCRFFFMHLPDRPYASSHPSNLRRPARDQRG